MAKIYFASNRLAAFRRSALNITESTTLGSPARYDSAVVGSAITAPRGRILTAFFNEGAVTEVYVQVSFNRPADGSGDLVRLVNSSGVPVFRVTLVSGGTTYRADFWNGSAWVTTGSTFILPNASLTVLDIRLTCGASGSYEVWINGFVAASVLGTLNAAVNNVDRVECISGLLSLGDMYFSQVWASDEPTLGRRLTSNVANANGANNDGTGSFSDTNSMPWNPDTFRRLPANGNKFTMTHAGRTFPGGYRIVAVGVNGAQRANGGVVANSRPVLRLSSTDYPGANVAPAPFATFDNRSAPFWFDNPNTAAAWANSEFNSLEFGWEARS